MRLPADDICWFLLGLICFNCNLIPRYFPKGFQNIPQQLSVLSGCSFFTELFVWSSIFLGECFMPTTFFSNCMTSWQSVFSSGSEERVLFCKYLELYSWKPRTPITQISGLHQNCMLRQVCCNHESTNFFLTFENIKFGKNSIYQFYTSIKSPFTQNVSTVSSMVLQW